MTPHNRASWYRFIEVPPLGHRKSGGLRAFPKFVQNQPDLVDAGALGDVDHVGHVAKLQAIVPLDEHHPVVAAGEDLLQLWTQHSDIDRSVLVDLHLVTDRKVGVHRNDDGPAEHRLVRLLFILVGLRHQGVEPFLGQRRDHHENDDQHQKHIDQRGNVHIHHRSPFAPTNGHRHSSTLLGACWLHSVPNSAATHKPLRAASRARLYADTTDAGVNENEPAPGTAYMAVAPPAGAPRLVSILSVIRPSESTPAARTSSITFTTSPYLARESLLT